MPLLSSGFRGWTAMCNFGFRGWAASNVVGFLTFQQTLQSPSPGWMCIPKTHCWKKSDANCWPAKHNTTSPSSSGPLTVLTSEFTSFPRISYYYGTQGLVIVVNIGSTITIGRVEVNTLDTVCRKMRSARFERRQSYRLPWHFPWVSVFPCECWERVFKHARLPAAYLPLMTYSHLIWPL
jgi:hypothetical protein